MRLIDADKLKEYVNTKSTHPLCEWDTAGVLMAIDEQETVEQKWIPLTESIPKLEQQVLICFDFKGKRSVDIGNIGSDKRVYCDSDEYLTPEGRKCRKAVAWMPLPEPYKA